MFQIFVEIFMSLSVTPLVFHKIFIVLYVYKCCRTVCNKKNWPDVKDGSRSLLLYVSKWDGEFGIKTYARKRLL